MDCLLLLNPYSWNANGGYIGRGVESDGAFYDTGKEVWDLLIKSRIAPWGNQSIFLHPSGPRWHRHSPSSLTDQAPLNARTDFDKLSMSRSACVGCDGFSSVIRAISAISGSRLLPPPSNTAEHVE